MSDPSTAPAPSKPEGPTTEADGGSAAAGATPEKRALVLLSIAIVAFMFIGMVGVLYYFSWWRLYKAGPIPTAIYMVQGSAQWDGVLVHIEEASQLLVEDTLRAENEYHCRFKLRPGTYNVVLSRKGKFIGTDNFILSDYQNRILTMRDPETRPTTQP